MNYEQLVGGEDVSTWVANQRKRLISLWAEVSSLVKERERSLGELDVLWKQFNEQKERVVEFMRTAELQMCHPSVLGRSDIDLSVIDAELGGCSVRIVRGVHTATHTHTHTHTRTHTHVTTMRVIPFNL